MASIARFVPRRSVRYLAMASTEPLASMSLPNSAPRRKIGKNCATKPAALFMKVCVQFASSGWPARSAAIRAHSGEKKNAPAPIGEPNQQTKSDQDSDDTHRASSSRQPNFTNKLMPSALRQQNIEIGARLAAEIFAATGQEIAGALPALRFQPCEEFPFGIELR